MKRIAAGFLVLLAMAVAVPTVALSSAPQAESTQPTVVETPRYAGPERAKTTRSTAKPSPTRSPRLSGTTRKSATDTRTTPVRPTAERPPANASQLNETRLERHLVGSINSYRDNPLRHDAVDETLRVETTTGQQLTTLARTHSDRMAAQSAVSPIAAGKDTRDRYEAFGLRTQCQLRDVDNAFIRPVEDLELVTSVAPNGANESRIANAVVDYWYDKRGPRETLSMPNAEDVGVGVATAEGVVYVTLALC